MPPKKTSRSGPAPEDQPPTRQQPRAEVPRMSASSAAEIALEEDIRFTVLESIQKAILTTACHASKRSALLKLLVKPSSAHSEFPVEHHRRVAIACIREVALNRLPLNTPPDSLKRYTTFIMELCKQYTREMKATYVCDNDDLPIALVEGLVSYHNAKDKNVRLMVVTLLNVLLGTLCDSVSRDNLYLTIANALKERAFDKCPVVREKAIGALRAFHTGEKDDDVTQVCLVAMCEDTNPKVREAAALCPPRYRSVHLRHIIRLTRDVNSSVRRASWEALSSYDLRTQLLSYCSQLHIDIISVVCYAFDDSCEAVKSASRIALTSWLNNCYKGDLAAMVDALFSIPVTISQPSAEAVLRFLISTSKDAWVPIGINTGNVSAANITLWKCSVLHFLDQNRSGGRFQDGDEEDVGGDGGAGGAGGGRQSGKFITNDDDSCGLPILPKFNVILTAVVNHYAGRPSAPPKDGRNSGLKSALQPQDIHVGEGENSQYIIDVLLSAFDIYADLGLLGHSDDAGRALLMRPLSFLLKVVTIDKPTCFVDAAVKTIVEISVRHEGEGMTSVESSLKMLFSLLSIPKKYELSYEDVEAYARHDFDRRRRVVVLENHRQRDGSERDDTSEEQTLIDDIATDDAVLLRMCRIVHAYLSCSRRGATLPTFISHVVHLARSQNYVAAKSLAMKCLTLQCLVNPHMVMTFLPIFIQEAMSGTQVDVATAAIGGLFDMINEYGNKFFDNSGSGPPPPGSAANVVENVDAEDASPGSLRRTKEEERRRELERLVARDDTHKPGSQVLTRQLVSLMQSPTEEIRYAASFGFCRLLAANRLLPEAMPLVLARLLLFLVGTDNNSDKCAEPVTLQMHRLIETFFRSFAFSHNKRQVAVLEGGLLALRMTLEEFNQRTGPSGSYVAPKIALKILKKVIQLTDAINTQQVRDVDPELSSRMAHQTAVEVARLSTHDTSLAVNASAAALNESTTSRQNQSGVSGRSAASTRGATLRLWRELGKHSLHERLSLELIAEAAHHRDNDAIVKLCLSDLTVMRLYKRDGNLYKTISSHVNSCCKALQQGASDNSEEYIAMLEAFLEGATKINAPPLEGTDLSLFAQSEEDHPSSIMRVPIETRIASRALMVNAARSILLVSETPATISDSAVRESLLMGRGSGGGAHQQASTTPLRISAPLFFDSPATEASLSQVTPPPTSAPARGKAASAKGSQGSTTTTTTVNTRATMDADVASLLKGTVTRRKR